MEESESDIRITTDTAYLALMGKLWGIFCEDFGENWSCYNGTALYQDINRQSDDRGHVPIISRDSFLWQELTLIPARILNK